NGSCGGRSAPTPSRRSTSSITTRSPTPAAVPPATRRSTPPARASGLRAIVRSDRHLADDRDAGGLVEPRPVVLAERQHELPAPRLLRGQDAERDAQRLA